MRFTRLVTLVGAADENSVRIFADEVEALEVWDDGGHGHGEHTAAAQGMNGRRRRRLQLGLVKEHAEAAQLRDEGRPRPDGRVRHEPEAVALLPQTGDRRRRANDRHP